MLDDIVVDSIVSSQGGFKRPCKALWRDTGAATAVEFGLLGGFFFIFMYGTIAMAITFFNMTSFDLSVYQAAREFQTGYAQNQGYSNFTPILQSTMINLNPAHAAATIVVATDANGNFNSGMSTTQTVSGTQNGVPFSYQVVSLKNQTGTPNFCLPTYGQVVYIQATYNQAASFPTLNLGWGSFIDTLLAGDTVVVEPDEGGSGGGC